MNKLKEQRAITLVALVITIIILLILAGVTLSLVLGDNGLIRKSKESAEKYNQSAQKETADLESYDEEFKSLLGDTITAKEIAKNPSKYYGKEIKGYTCENDEAINAWKIFFADENNIYIISDDYISYENAPKGKKGTEITKGKKSNYDLGFVNVCNDYTGAADITNEKIKKWFTYLEKYPTSEKTNAKATAYILDTNVWGKFAGNNAEYAIGGPTLEMFCESYNSMHDKKIEYIVESYGYDMRWGADPNNTEYNDNISGLDRTENLYVLSKENVNGYWLATPSAFSDSSLSEIFLPLDKSAMGSIVFEGFTNEDGSNVGMRPVVCLKNSVKLEKQDENSYKIIE